MTDIKLRPYQQDFIDNVRNEFKNGHKRVVGVAPCGAGKTIMTGWMIKQSLNRGKRSIFFVHRKELIEQTSKTFSALDIPHGIIAADIPMQSNLPVQIASVQTLAKRLDKVPTPDFLICDECHHILANTYQKILDAFPNAFLLGVTATPLRMGGITLEDVFDSMVTSLSVNQLIQLGNLTKFNYFAHAGGVDLRNVRINKFGEFDNNDLESVMSDNRVIGDIVKNYKKFANGKSTICYCVNVNHSKSVADSFNQAGIPAAHCDGETPKLIRANIVNDFRNGKIKVLCNAELFGEGFDVPRCQAVILARPTLSLTLFIQQAMRAMRPDPDDPDKVAVIIDHIHNHRRHGLPNMERYWSLDPNVFKDRKSTIAPTKTCPKCEAVISLGFQTCPHCGFQFPVDDTVEAERDAIFLPVPVDFQSKKEASAPSIKHSFSKPEEFLTFAEKRNYKIGWVAFQSLKHAQSYDDCLHIAEICHYNKGWAWHQWNKISNRDLQI